MPHVGGGWSRGGIALRKNYLIFAVACILILAVLAFAERKKKFFIGVVLIVLSATLAHILPIKFYEYRAHNTMGAGVPALSYIAMGLQGSGGWNGYHSDLYMRCNYQADMAKEISKQSIGESLAYMRENPMYAVDFFYQKQVGQWCNETYGFVYETVYLFDDRSEAAWEIYCGKWTDPLLKIMNVYQSAVYLGTLLFLIGRLWHWIKNKESRKNIMNTCGHLWEMVWIVTVIGGFLFSMMWEAASRYTLPYLVILTPYAAEGMYQILQKTMEILSKSAACRFLNRIKTMQK